MTQISKTETFDKQMIRSKICRETYESNQNSELGFFKRGDKQSCC